MSVEERFARAQQDVNSLPERPSNNELLKLYALFKQATIGDVEGERPAGFDFKAIAKFDAWADVKGKPPEQSMEEYIALVSDLQSPQ